MKRFALLLVLVPAGFGQSSDAVLTQTLISEIRTLRQQIEATTIASQRVQIALYRLQSQTALVAAAQQRLDGARLRLLEAQTGRRRVAQDVQTLEQRARDLQDPAQKKEIEVHVTGLKNEIEGFAAEESQRRSAEADAESLFRAEQARLFEIQGLLDRLDKALDDLSHPKH